MKSSCKISALAIGGLIGAVALLALACGRGGRAEGPSPAVSEPTASTTAEAGAPSAAAAAGMATVEFDVAGMTCGGCAIATEAALERLDGVRSAEASYDDETGAGRAVVEYDSAKVSPERMIEAIGAIGYHPRIRTGGD